MQNLEAAVKVLRADVQIFRAVVQNLEAAVKVLRAVVQLLRADVQFFFDLHDGAACVGVVEGDIAGNGVLGPDDQVGAGGIEVLFGFVEVFPEEGFRVDIVFIIIHIAPGVQCNNMDVRLAAAGFVLREHREGEDDWENDEREGCGRSEESRFLG